MDEAAGSAGAATSVPRPATVTVAFTFQVALVATLLLMIGMAVAGAVHFDALIDQAARAPGADPGEAAAERSGNLAGALAAAVPELVLAVWLGSTAFPMRRGSNVARILTLVGLGTPLVLGLLGCLVGGAFGMLFALAGPDAAGPDGDPVAGPDDSVFYQQLDRLDSDGWSIVLGVLGMAGVVLALLFGVATGVLLLTGASDRYFRPRRPAPPPMTYPIPYPYPPAYGYQPYWYPAPPPPPMPGPAPPAGPPPTPPPG